MPDGCSAVTNRLTNGMSVIAISRTSSTRPVQTLAACDDHRGSVPVSHWMGRTQTRTSTMSTTASAEAMPTSRSEKAR